jgi:hypothetical protein
VGYNRTKRFLVKISESNRSWLVYDVKDLGFTPYNRTGIQCDSKNRVWGMSGIETGVFFADPPHFFIFDGEKATLLSCEGEVRFSDPQITIDHNDYVWSAGVSVDEVTGGSSLGVWIDEQWFPFDAFVFGGSRVKTVKEDPNHRIWFGTSNGVYIRQKTD